jgi:ferric-dicitrate binding protein FerR (iron transport regulator)
MRHSSTPSSSPPIDPELFGRVLAGGGSDADQDVVRAFLRDHPEFDVLTRVACANEPHEPFGAPDEARQRLAAQLGVTPNQLRFWGSSWGSRHRSMGDQSAGYGLRRMRAGESRSRWHVAVACAALLLGAIGVYRAKVPAGTERHDVVARTYSTRPRQQAQITLQDGTRVTLAPQTTLVMRGTEGTLVGEAFFTVTHRAATPFVIRTGAVTTRVLGTAFGVRRYAGDDTTRVVVSDGKVVTGAARSAVVAAHGVGQVTDSTVTVETVEDLTTLTGWTQGRLVFRDVPARDVLTAVGRWYGVIFRIPDSALVLPVVNTAFDTRRSQSEIFAALEVVLDAQMTAVGDTIVVAPRRKTTRPASERRSVRDSLNILFKEIGR